MSEKSEQYKLVYQDGFIKGYNKAIDNCIEIVKFHKDTWDGIEWAIRDIEQLKEMESD